jgi:hypothetical protein
MMYVFTVVHITFTTLPTIQYGNDYNRTTKSSFGQRWRCS